MDVANRFGRLREMTQTWLARARTAAPRSLPWIAGAIGVALALVVTIAVILIVVRAGDAISHAFVGSAPLLGGALAYLLVSALLIGSFALFLVALIGVVRLAVWAITAIMQLGAARPSAQAERYVIAGLVALLPAAGIYFIASQDTFRALPLELKLDLVPIMLPFAVGAAAALAWGRSAALTMTALSLAAVAGIIVLVGYLGPGQGAAMPDPLSVIWRWVELMRQSAPVQRLWWLLLVLLTIIIWSVATFAGFGEKDAPRAVWRPGLPDASPIPREAIAARD